MGRQAGESSPRIAAVVPSYNEGRGLAAAVSRLEATAGLAGGVVVDASTAPGSRAVVAELERGARSPAFEIVRAPRRGRAAQMNLGARRVAADVLLFVHVDTRLPAGAVDLVAGRVAAGAIWGRFDVRFDDPGRALRVIAWAMNRRSAATGICTGDQCLFVSRAAFDEVGGYPEIALMEDVEISRRLKRLSAPARIRAPVTTSARRWRERGLVRTVVGMWVRRLAYWAGASPERLALGYGDVRE